MDRTRKLQIETNITNDSKEISPEKKSFINKLYLDPIESLNKKLAETKSKGFHIKTDVSKTNTEYSSSMGTTQPLNTGMSIPPVKNLRNLNMNRTQGNVIMQNWETAKNIPSDIGEFIHFPVLVDRNKLKLGMDLLLQEILNLAKIKFEKTEKNCLNHSIPKKMLIIWL